MRIMLLGAAGFIGRHILAELQKHDHEVVAVVRRVDGMADAYPDVRFVALDLAETVTEEHWLADLDGIDCVINAAGVLRGPDMTPVHVTMPQAMCAAAARAGIQRIVLISAISARPEVATDYSISKLAGEAALRSSSIGWTILRPSIVYGHGSYGGTSLLRGLAGLPLIVPLPGRGDFGFTPIHIRDLARAVRIVCEDEAFAGQTLEPVGPEHLDLRDLLIRYRQWLGFKRARFVPIPMPVMRMLGWIGDRFGKGPISTNSLSQMVAGNAGDSQMFVDEIGFEPRSLGTALRDHPAQVQDRWHARLFFVAPVLKAALILMWCLSAIMGLFFGAGMTGQLVEALGLPTSWADPLRIGSSLLDIGIAALLVLDRSARWSTLAQAAVVLGYTLVIGFALPQLWFDPLGPLLKNIPVLVAILVYGAIGDRR